MSEKESKSHLVDHDELSIKEEPKEKNKLSESTGLISNLKKNFGVEFNGLFFIILSIIVFAIAITIAMVLSIFFGPPQIRPHAGISTEVGECTALGLEICRQGGSGVDSAISAFLCIAIARPDITGLGGCGSMLIHNHSSMQSQVIDFSCVAPPNAQSVPIKDGFEVKESVALPGVFSGLKLSHQLYGKMNWTKIVQSVIQTLSKGIQVSPAMQEAFSSSEFQKLPVSFRNLYSNWGSPPVFKPSKELLNLLWIIHNDTNSGIDGSLAKEMINLGFPWTGKLDTARMQKPLRVVFGDYSLYTAPLPSKGGLDLAIAFSILDKVVSHKDLEKETPLFYHRLLESFKVAQASTSFLGGSDNGTDIEMLSNIQNLIQTMGKTATNPNRNYGPYYRLSNIESGSGTHISVVDPNSLYVSLSVNLGSKFGSGVVTQSGIILNDAMRLFSINSDSNVVPGTRNQTSKTSNNIAAPGIRPLNQLTPLVVYNFKRKCGVRFAIGGDHGSISPTGNLQIVMAAIYLDQKFCPSKDCMELSKAGSRALLHVNLLSDSDPNSIATIFYDENFPSNIKLQLEKSFNHTNSGVFKSPHSVNSIGKVQYEIQGFSNSKNGQFAYF